MQQLRVAMVGGGFMGKAHALAYAAMPIFFWPAPMRPVRKLMADATDELAADAADRYGFESATGRWEDAVEADDIDLVDICTPNNLHADIAIAAARAGKHVICEKPLANSADEAREMLDAVRQAGVTHMVAFNYRRTPAVALARRFVEEGRIGEITNFRGTYLQDWSADPDAPLSWRFQQKIAGSGALGDIGTHVVDFARYLVGEIAAVNAVTRTYIADRPIQAEGLDKLGGAERGSGPRAPVEVDDEMMTFLRFTNGAVGSIEATRNAHGRNNFLTFELHGSEGSIVFNYERRDELQVSFANDPADRKGFRTIYTGPAHPYGEGLWPIPALGIGYGETKIIECFDLCTAVGSGQLPSPNFEDGYRIACITDAILDSAQSQQWVDVPA